MQFANDLKGKRIQATRGTYAHCPTCKGVVLAKCGSINVHHWAHQSRLECDAWSEPESPWHRSWKDAVPEDWREVAMGPHRADIRTPEGLVVEIQHSSISPADVQAREAFYGNMLWLLDGRNFVLSQSRRSAICGQFVRARTRGFILPINKILVEDPYWSFGTNRRTFQVSTKPIAFDMGGFLVISEGLRLWTKGRSPGLYLKEPFKVTPEAFTACLTTAGASSPPE